MSNIPNGYKQTEVGVIPDDWEVKHLKQISPKQSVGLVINPSSYFDDNGTVPILVGSNIKENYINWEFAKRISDESNKLLPASRLAAGDLVTVRVGEPGITAVVPPELDGSNCASVMIVRQHHTFDSNWLCYAMNSKNGLAQVEHVQYGTAQKQFNISDVINFYYAVPPLNEQSTIATALSDTDALISSLEKLIAKKRNIKQGAMQTLLQPKKNWGLKLLPEVCWFQEGPGVRNSQFTISGVKLLNGTNIEDGKLHLEKTDRYISEKEAFGWYSHFLVDDGDILIACSGVTIDKFQEKVTIASKFHLPLCMNTSTMRFKIISDILYKNFFFHFLKSKSFKEQIGGKATGSAQLNFGPSHMKMVEIILPPLGEQIQIATILSDIDVELTALETKLAKLKNIKHGMMQNLLTGKIRLV